MCNCGGSGPKPKIKLGKDIKARRIAAAKVNALNRAADRKLSKVKAKKK